eukprot:gene6262-2890_t
MKKSSLVIYGGVGRSVLDDLSVLDADTMCWSQITTSANSANDRPGKLLGHAAVCVGNRMWMFGGQEGRSFLRKFYSIDADTWKWKRHTTDTLPSARAGHGMAAVDNLIYLFGGQGKKMYNDLYIFNPEEGVFKEVKPRGGKPPTPRKGMSFVYDGKDSLICFGGTHAGGIDNQLTAFSISKQEWYTPPQLGSIPSAQTNHSAVTLSPRRVLFFGGCNSHGVFSQAAYVLDTRTFTWHRPHQLNTPPAPRYYHTCNVVGSRVLLYGGISAQQTYDGVVVLDSKFNNDISHIAEELQSLMTEDMDSHADSSRAGSGMSSQRGVSCSITSSLDLMKLQLTDLLLKRNMEEMHAQAAKKAEETIGLLNSEKEAKGVLNRELLQAKLMAAECDEACVVLKAKLKESELKAIKDATSLNELKSTYDKILAEHAGLMVELDQCKSLNEGLEYCDGLHQHRQSKLGMRTSHKAPLDLQHNLTERLSPSDTAQASKNSHSRVSAPEARSTSPTESSSNDYFEERTSATTDVPARVLLEQLSRSEDCRASLLEETQRLHMSLDVSMEKKASLGIELHKYQANPESLAQMSHVQLQELEGRIEKSLRSVRDVIMHRKIAEAREQVASEHNVCSICLEAPKSVAFCCGHQSCLECSTKLVNCPFCRKEITAKIKLYAV